MIVFHSKLDSSKTKALNKKAFKKLLWLYAFLSLLIIFIGIVSISFKEDSSDATFGIFFIVFGLLITPLGYLFTRVLQRRIDKSTVYISSDTEEIYTFDEQYITITQRKGDEFSATIKARYSYIYKAYEDKNYYYLYISKMQSHVIDKSSITQGSLHELHTLLKNNLGNRFKV